MTREHCFPRQAPNASTTAASGVVCDGVSGLTWRANTLYIGTTNGQPPPITPSTMAGNAVFQVYGLHEKGYYLRRFALQAWRQVELDMSAWRDVRVELLGSTLLGFDVYATVTERVMSTSDRDPVVYPEQATAAGTWIVPWGAKGLWAGTADAGFAWVSTDAAGIIFTIPDPIAPGDQRAVKGTRYTTTAAFDGVWEIQL